MAVVEVIVRKRVRSGQVDEHEVRVGARLYASLAREAEPAGNVVRCDASDEGELEAPGAMALTQQKRKHRLATGDAAPGGERVCSILQPPRCRRVVRCDHRQRSLGERVPERLALAARAQRRRALRDVAEGLGILVGQRQVVRARLTADVDAPGTGGGHERDPAAGRDVNHVQRAAAPLRKLDRACDRLKLGDGRP